MSEKLHLPAVAPGLCAGIATWPPLRHWNIGKGHKVGILGLGGPGHMAVKFAVSFGAEVTMLSTSPSRQADAERPRAHHFLLTKDAEAVKAAAGSFDIIIDTVSAEHDYALYLDMLKTNSPAAVGPYTTRYHLSLIPTTHIFIFYNFPLPSPLKYFNPFLSKP